MKDWLMEHKIKLGVVLSLVLGGFYYFYAQGSGETSTFNTTSQETESLKTEVETKSDKPVQAATAQPEKIMVDVKGQVKNPGVYQSSTDERVMDVIGRAGGLTDQADQTQVNLAEHVVDEMVIYIPAKGEEGGAIIATSGPSSNASGGTGQNQGKIDLNKADEQELQNLPGIGPAKAAAIIEYRNTSGPFKAIEDLKNITGIGDKTFEKLKDLIVVK
ncbi:helix-hairpin-helix domain-containing protein [Neobacillus cucumis]|uniref:helix-hairpin-helix domain-containing protein n=1 Tax=Neobacillus cucumis TaxID=1740721 RepID=UPI0028534B0E|nr:helix-hairpin-helix domain-containing protein [Neobacillus cucumis]MDR4948657.1 helix-hairpin-helix domain-containing protein [Neobacillus cucumis]